jgi:hypothetical protein
MALLSALEIALAIHLLFVHGPNAREDDMSTVAPEPVGYKNAPTSYRFPRIHPFFSDGTASITK